MNALQRLGFYVGLFLYAVACVTWPGSCGVVTCL